MKKNYVSNSGESPRMFKNDLLESISKVHFTVPIFLYVPVIAYFSYKAVTAPEMNLLFFSALFALGLLLWSLTEYFIHRFIFHFQPKQAWGKRLHFIFHGVHHDYPKDAKRLVMPPSVSIPLAFFFYGFYGLFVPAPYLWALFSGLVMGYLLYDMIHYAIHHFNIKNAFWKKIQRHHAIHHYGDAGRGYGVSSPLWDKIFNTGFDKKPQTAGTKNQPGADDVWGY
jgi:sterol desaturase/sphingolipid hydroxylase (fatty acid hydroxylase superfamily)